MTLRHRLLFPLLAASALTLGGPLGAEEEVIATVNGNAITQEDFQRFVFEATQGVKGTPQIDQQEVLSELLARELIHQDALKQGLDKRQELIAEVERLRYRLLVTVALEEVVKKHPTTDKELQTLYDKEVKNLKPREFKTRHILVKEKSLAEQIITELDLGGDFAKLAEKHSGDNNSNKKGGDIGWFTPQPSLPEFSRAVLQLEKDKYTQAPVQSPVGWHVIKVEEIRDVPPPSFEQIKPRLAQIVQQQKVNDYIQSLKEKAEIKFAKP
ncbi:MAG: peptidylprolyl isomerase [Gammaproteobacteria bacterium]|nr:peptidylprolyl isomerase [Gammaproteobacteria bacterium]